MKLIIIVLCIGILIGGAEAEEIAYVGVNATELVHPGIFRYEDFEPEQHTYISKHRDDLLQRNTRVRIQGEGETEEGLEYYFVEVLMGRNTGKEGYVYQGHIVEEEISRPRSLPNYQRLLLQRGFERVYDTNKIFTEYEPQDPIIGGVALGPEYGNVHYMGDNGLWFDIVVDGTRFLLGLPYEQVRNFWDEGRYLIRYPSRQFSVLYVYHDDWTVEYPTLDGLQETYPVAIGVFVDDGFNVLNINEEGHWDWENPTNLAPPLDKED